MTRRPGRLSRAAAVTALAAVSQCAGSATAAPVSPPPIDNTLLPAAAPASPPQPTVQRAVCTVPGFDPQLTDAPSQLDRLDLPAVWPLSRGTGQRVAVIDTGVSPHRRLAGLAGGGDYVARGDGTVDCDGHGTLVAGVIAATPDPGGNRFSGVAPAATVLAIRQSSNIFGPVADPAQAGVGDVETLAKAVRTAADLGASVINVSSVACQAADSGLDDRALGAALAYAVDVKHAVVVTPAGNTGDAGHCPTRGDETGRASGAVVVSPAWYDEYVLTVGSVDADGAPSAFTLPGRWVDVAAPGEAVLSLSPVGDALANSLGEQGRSEPIYGTSYAAAVVSGLAALLRSRFPDWTPHQVMDRIKATAHHPPGGRDDLVGSGAVDPLAAVGTDTPPKAGIPQVDQAPTTPTPTPTSEPSGRRAALNGAAALLTVLVVVLAGRALHRRLGRLPVSGAVD